MMDQSGTYTQRPATDPNPVLRPMAPYLNRTVVERVFEMGDVIGRDGMLAEQSQIGPLVVGQDVPVLRHEGRPLVLNRMVPRAKFSSVTTTGGVIEELLIIERTSTDGVTTRDVWFRNDQTFAPLHLTALEARIPAGQLGTPFWGADRIAR